MEVLISVFLFIFGTIIGSFLVASVGRVERHDKSRWSHCVDCGHRLTTKDLVPVWSWLRLRGKCRYCGAKIGGFEVLGEILVGGLFVAAYWFFPLPLGIYDALWRNWLIFVIFLVLLAILVFLGFFDAKKGLFPEKVLTFLVICAIIYKIAAFILVERGSTGAVFSSGIWDAIVDVLMSVGILAGVYFLLYKVSSEQWVGSGDWILMLAIAVVLANPFLAFLELFLANFLASGVILATRVFGRSLGRGKLKRQIAFGPFIIVAFFLVFFLQNCLLGLAKSIF